MKKEKTIRDPIHGNIKLNELEIKLLDTPEMQRLRRIKQNGFCYLVYPAMNSSRFEHSLGVMHLAGLLSNQLSLDKKEKEILRVSALLHDIGHGPFSHTSDVLFKKFNYTHEENSSKIIRSGEISEILRDHGLNPHQIARLIEGKGKLSQLLSSEIDLDKMDYLIRDSYYAGVAYGVIDLERVIQGIKLLGGMVVIKEDSLEAVESLIISRNLMHETVYRHHTKRIIENMFTHALSSFLEKEKISKEEFSQWDDFAVVNKLRNSQGYAKEIIERIEERNLFKIFFQERIKSFPSKFIKNMKKDTKGLELKISHDFGIPEGYLLADLPEMSFSEFRILIETKNGLKRIDEVSTLVRALESSEKEKLTFCLYTPLEYKERLKDFKIGNYVNFS